MALRLYAAALRPLPVLPTLGHVERQGWRWWRPRNKADALLFPGYLFLYLDLSEPGWEAVNGTRGIAHLLPVHLLMPLPLPEDFRESVEGLIALGLFDEPEPQVMWFERNEELQVTAGPLAGHRGRFQRKTKGCAEILMSCLGRETTVRVPIHQLASGRKAA